MQKLFIVFRLLLSLQQVKAQEKVTLQTEEEVIDTTYFSRLLRSYNQIIRAE